MCRGRPPNTVSRRLPYCRGGYRRISRILAAGKCDGPRSTAERERQEVEEEDSDDGRQRGRTRGRPPRAADDTKMPSASFSSTRSYLRRSRRKNGNRIPLPRTGKREVNERASERVSERTNERASERNGERANERTSEEGRTEGASESEATRQRQRHGSPCRVSGIGAPVQDPVRRTPSMSRSRRRCRRCPRVGDDPRAPPSPSCLCSLGYICTRRVSCSPLLRYPPISPRLVSPRPRFSLFSGILSFPETLLLLGTAEFGIVLKKVTSNRLCPVKRERKVI